MTHVPAVIESPYAIGGIAVGIVALLLVDLLVFARGREPSFGEAARWSVFWFVLSLAVAIPIYLLVETEDAVNYTTVYLIERTLSIDNLFVFLLLFAYFGIPRERRPVLLFWGIVLALVMSGAEIMAGVELLERAHVAIYVLGALLLALAYRMLKGASEEMEPERTLVVRVARRIVPGATPIGLALVSIVLADITFAIDSIPAAFAITRDEFTIWMANGFALMGMRALFVLTEELIRRFRYLDQTLAVVLGLVAIKLLLSDVVKISAGISLAVVAATFAVGITASLRVQRREDLLAAMATVDDDDDLPPGQGGDAGAKAPAAAARSADQ